MSSLKQQNKKDRKQEQRRVNGGLCSQNREYEKILNMYRNNLNNQSTESRLIVQICSQKLTFCKGCRNIHKPGGYNLCLSCRSPEPAKSEPAKSEPAESGQKFVESDFQDPITLDLIKDPVFLISNSRQFYSRNELTKWVEVHNTNPLTRELCTLSDIITVTDESYLLALAQLVALNK